jgi:hypothetical protein
MSDTIGRITVPSVINSGQTFPLTTRYPFGFSVERPVIVHRFGVRRHGDFILRKVHHPDRSMLDLGHCQIGEEKGSGDPHLSIHFSEASLLAAEMDGVRIFGGVDVAISWDDKRWFRVIGTR